MKLLVMTVLICQNINSAEWCGSPWLREEVSFPKQEIALVKEVEIRYLADTYQDTAIRAVMGRWPKPSRGCQVTTKNKERHLTDQPCPKFRKRYGL